ncbi:MAG: type II secretion system protein [Planctomycetota bacterium]
MEGHPERGGFTLLEMLAVIALLSLVAGFLAPGLVAGHEAASFAATCHLVQELDARARFFARTGGPVLLGVRDEGHLLVLVRAKSGEILSQRRLPKELSVRLTPEGEKQYDRAGCCADYVVHVRGQGREASFEEARLKVAGETGWVQERKDRRD